MKVMITSSSEPAPQPQKVTTEVYDLVVEEFNSFDSSKRCEIWERGIELWIASRIHRHGWQDSSQPLELDKTIVNPNRG